MSTQRTISVIPLAELEKLAKAARALSDDLDAFVVAHEMRFREPDTKSALLHAKRQAANAQWAINRTVDNEGASFATHLKETAVAMARAQQFSMGEGWSPGDEWIPPTDAEIRVPIEGDSALCPYCPTEVGFTVTDESDYRYTGYKGCRVDVDGACEHYSEYREGMAVFVK